MLSPARPKYGQEAIISIRGFRYAMLAQATGEKGEGPPALAAGTRAFQFDRSFMPGSDDGAKSAWPPCVNPGQSAVPPGR